MTTNPRERSHNRKSLGFTARSWGGGGAHVTPGQVWDASNVHNPQIPRWTRGPGARTAGRPMIWDLAVVISVSCKTSPKSFCNCIYGHTINSRATANNYTTYMSQLNSYWTSWWIKLIVNLSSSSSIEHGRNNPDLIEEMNWRYTDYSTISFFFFPLPDCGKLNNERAV